MDDKVVWDRLGRLDDAVSQQQDQLVDHEKRLQPPIVDEMQQRIEATNRFIAEMVTQQAAVDEEDRARGYRLVWGRPEPL